jgi:hypothetical protein
LRAVSVQWITNDGECISVLAGGDQSCLLGEHDGLNAVPSPGLREEAGEVGSACRCGETLGAGNAGSWSPSATARCPGLGRATAGHPHRLAGRRPRCSHRRHLVRASRGSSGCWPSLGCTSATATPVQALFLGGATARHLGRYQGQQTGLTYPFLVGPGGRVVRRAHVSPRRSRTRRLGHS